MIFSRCNVLIFALILGQQQFASHVNCLIKTAINQWFENPKTWSAKRFPCPMDTVILPENVALYLDRPISASLIILPKNGILILERENWISKVNDRADCSEGQENKLVIPKNDWFDTTNCNVKYQTFDYQGDDELTNPVPHINRIPCQQDDVRFSPKSTFKISIDSVNKNYKLKNLIINNQKLASRDFERYTKSKIGKLQFNINGPLPFYVTNADDSSEHSVQFCQNNFNFFYNKICRNVISKCPILNCINPIQPIGHCCQICGGLVCIEHIENSMDYDFVQATIENIHSEKYGQTVNYFVTKISENGIEIILLNTRPNVRKSKEFGQELVNLFKRNKFYQLKTIEHLYSEWVDDRQDNKLLWFMVVILLLIISILLFIYHNDLSPRLNRIYDQIRQRSINSSSTDTPFTFIRFAGDHEDLDITGPELEMEINSSDQEYTLRTHYTQSVQPSNISNKSGILFKVDEQDEENISFFNPSFRKEIKLFDQTVDKLDNDQQ